MKLPIFHGNDTDDPEQYWFLCKVVWTARQINDDNVKKVQLATTLHSRVLDWYMIFIQVPQGTMEKNLDEIQKGLLDKFKKQKYEAQYITELKEIKQFPNEMVWEFDQSFKTLMSMSSLI